MSPKVSTLSPSQLRGLKLGSTIMVRYRQQTNLDSIILAEAFPMKVAITFSGLCQATFSKDPCKQKGKTVTIEGGRIEDHKDVLRWMLSCCEGNGIRPFKVVKVQPFWTYANALASAQTFQIAALEEQLSTRLHNLAAKQVHSEDIHEVYSFLPRGHPVRSMAADSIGAALLEKRLLARGAYECLKVKFPEFNEDLDLFMDGQREKREENRKAAHDAQEARRKANQERRRVQAEQRAKYLWNEKAKVTAGLDAEELKVTVDANMVTHVSAPAKIARRSAKGRPTYLKADPVLLGLKAQNFRPLRQIRSTKPVSDDSYPPSKPSVAGSAEQSM